LFVRYVRLCLCNSSRSSVSRLSRVTSAMLAASSCSQTFLALNLNHGTDGRRQDDRWMLDLSNPQEEVR
jgi:hypothetical protein